MRDQINAWRVFLRTTGATVLALLVFLLATVIVVDPHDHLPVSPSFTRAPINTNQRYSYPALARAARFDSVVLGTSTVRMLEPKVLERHLEGRFVTLAMNSATAYEQSRIGELFVRHHPKPRTVMIGLDSVWCGEASPRYTFRAFPEWLYDDNPSNDFLHLLDGNTLEQTGRQLEYLAGRRPPRYGFDGFENFLEAKRSYDFSRALELLYGPQGPRDREPGPSTPAANPSTVRGWPFPALERLDEMMTWLPATTTKILFFVPYHHFHQPAPLTTAGLRIAECKRRVTALADRHANLHVLDFMIESAITLDDRNYWDPLHYSLTTARRIALLLANGVRERRGRAGLFAYLNGVRQAAPDTSEAALRTRTQR